MIPAPNVLAGIMIGLANTSWSSTLLSSVAWPFVFCVYVSMAHRSRRDATIAAFGERGDHLLLGSPRLTFYSIEFATALVTALPVAVVMQVIKRLLT